MDDYNHLHDICTEYICNTEKLFVHCKEIISKQPMLFSNNDWKKICKICTDILNDPYYKDREGVIESYVLLPGIEETIFQTLDEKYSELIEKHGALTIDLDTSKSHFLNADIGLSNLNYPFLRVLCAKNYKNIEEMCTLLLNRHHLKDIYSKCQNIDITNIESVTPLQLKVVLLANKIK